MTRQKANRLIFFGAALTLGSILLMDPRDVDGGVVRNILAGSKIISTVVDARWPVLLGLLLICWGIYRRLEEK